MSDRELMQQALDWYRAHGEVVFAIGGMGAVSSMNSISEALRARLAQPEQEPVAYDKTDLNAFVQNLYDVKMREGKHGHYETMFYVVQQTIKHVCGNKQPVAWLCKNKKSGGLFALTREQLTELGYGNISMPPFEKTAPLYTAPPQRDEAPAKAVEWQGLTDEERTYLAWESNNGQHCVAMTEAKLKEKNNDNG